MAAQICETCKNKGKRCVCAPNSTCGAYEPRTMTHFEEIKAMNVEAMADFLMKWAVDFMMGESPMNVKGWLESEVEK